MTRELKVAFAGTPALAVTILKRIIDCPQYLLNHVYTQPDKPAGRGRKLKQSEVKTFALQHRLTIHQPEKPIEIDPECNLANVDVLIVAAYGMLLPEEILNRPRLGCINVHTSLLPRWRGAAPIQRAIEAGDSETGVTIMQMDKGLDTGNILTQRKCSITDDETAGSLHDRLAELGAEALVDTLSDLQNSAFKGIIQDDDQASYAAKITKTEAAIDWTLSASSIERKIRAFNPFPVAHTCLNGIQMRIFDAEIVTGKNMHASPGSVLNSSNSSLEVMCADHAIRINELQVPGKRRVSAAEFLNGHQNFCSDDRR
ncbi:MAG: methionyl-tRNA formyltransferase [Gammaproteobacteria bacterium]|nr:methionyl-tRNA formyltransferase [Gammaproteobacteria bacterium]